MSNLRMAKLEEQVKALTARVDALEGAVRFVGSEASEEAAFRDALRAAKSEREIEIAATRRTLLPIFAAADPSKLDEQITKLISDGASIADVLDGLVKEHDFAYLSVRAERAREHSVTWAEIGFGEKP